MSEATRFEARHNYGHIVKGKKIVGFIDFAGDDLLIPVNGKQVLFEFHHYFGPHPISKLTGDPLKNIPKGFWDAIERWQLGGQLVSGGVCVVPEWCPLCKGHGKEVRHIGGHHWEVVGPCKKCKGKQTAT